MNCLSVERLCVSFSSGSGRFTALNDINFEAASGESICVIGPSGSGKTTLWLAMLGLLPRYAEITGNVQLPGRSQSNPPSRMRDFLRLHVGTIFQDAFGSLIPGVTVGTQLTRVFSFRKNISVFEARVEAKQALARVGFANPDKILPLTPSQLSGGMCQRVAISQMLAAPGPLKLMVADEPLSALDSVSAVAIRTLLLQIHAESHANFIFITHDARHIPNFDWVAVISEGRLQEFQRSTMLLNNPSSQAAIDLLEAAQRLQTSENLGGDK